MMSLVLCSLFSSKCFSWSVITVSYLSYIPPGPWVNKEKLDSKFYVSYTLLPLNPDQPSVISKTSFLLDLYQVLGRIFREMKSASAITSLTTSMGDGPVLLLFHGRGIRHIPSNTVLMDVYHPLPANLKQLLSTIETREMRDISCEAFRIPLSAPCKIALTAIDGRTGGPST